MIERRRDAFDPFENLLVGLQRSGHRQFRARRDTRSINQLPSPPESLHGDLLIGRRTEQVRVNQRLVVDVRGGDGDGASGERSDEGDEEGEG